MDSVRTSSGSRDFFIERNDLVLDSESGIYIPRGERKKFSYSDGDAVEKYLLDVMRKVADKTSNSAELEAWIKDWPTRYHLSRRRANLLRGLDMFLDASRVLELGAGCGSVTRFLGERFESVDAVEGSLMRASIARRRCSDLKNVRIITANFFDLTFRQEYDLVTLIGVLEYAPVFYQTENKEDACLVLLELAHCALKETGALILAIENKLGLKYWVGCGEDHTGRPYDGIHGYPRKGTAITFSRRELRALLQKAGFKAISWYYPFPDYKLPDTILSETSPYFGSLYLHNWLIKLFEDYSGSRSYSIHDALACRSVYNAGLLGELANSFLIVAQKNKTSIPTSNWIAKRFSVDRKPCYAMETTLYGSAEIGFKVSKKVMTPCREGLSETLTIQEQTNEWYPGDLLVFRFFELLFDPRPYERFRELVKLYHDILLQKCSIEGRDSEGYPLLDGTAVDFSPWNIIDNNGSYVFIDQEWGLKDLIPIDYVLFRSLFEINSHKPYLRKAKIGNFFSFSLKLIASVYPQYNRSRHRKNMAREDIFQELVSGKQRFLMSHKTIFRVLRNEGYGSLLKKIKKLVR